MCITPNDIEWGCSEIEALRPCTEMLPVCHILAEPNRGGARIHGNVVVDIALNCAAPIGSAIVRVGPDRNLRLLALPLGFRERRDESPCHAADVRFAGSDLLAAVAFLNHPVEHVSPSRIVTQPLLELACRTAARIHARVGLQAQLAYQSRPTDNSFAGERVRQ